MSICSKCVNNRFEYHYIYFIYKRFPVFFIIIITNMFFNMPFLSSTSPNTITYRRFASAGFTLIELLVVISVLLILSGITFGISRGVQNAQARAQVKAELAVIAQGLESFKACYGDYPWHDSDDTDYPTPSSGDSTNTMLLYALTGRMDMQKDINGLIIVDKISDNLDDNVVTGREKFIDVSKFSFSGTDREPNQLLDPWGNPYRYWYKWENTENNPNNDKWDIFGYHLYSTGPKGIATNVEISSQINRNGVVKDDFRDTVNESGIIFAGE